MQKLSRRSLIAHGLIGTQALLTACGGGDGEAVASTATPSDLAPAPGATGAAPAASAPVAAPVPAPAPAPAPAPPAPAPAPAPVWDVGPALRLVADANTRFDLSITLPAAVRRGGSFKLAAGSPALPAGVTLSSSGILMASASAGVTSIAGLVFSYDEP